MRIELVQVGSGCDQFLCTLAIFLVLIWVVVSNIFYFHPYLGKIPILTNVFRRGWNHQPVIFFCIIVLIIQQTICKSVEEVGPPRKHLYGGALLSNYRHHEEQMTRGNFGFRLSMLGNNKKWNIINRTLSIRSTDAFSFVTDMIFQVWMIL